MQRMQGNTQMGLGLVIHGAYMLEDTSQTGRCTLALTCLNCDRTDKLTIKNCRSALPHCTGAGGQMLYEIDNEIS